ncbi:MAG: hypothetical protein ACI9F9_002320 [Candidatus Paceibacteria bacterium]|jgi:hypothetical protein
MIRINLLPDEYQRTARTPFKMMLAVSTVVTINASLAAWAGWLGYGVTAAVDSELAVLLTEDDGLKPQVVYHESLSTESKQHTLREETLSEINESRISWTRKVDELVDVVNRGGGGERHLIWFDSMNIKQDGSGGRNGSTGSLKANGHSGSDQFGQVANFLDDLEDSPFISDFDKPAPPEGSGSIEDKDLIPAVVWDFPLNVSLKASEESK